MGVWMEVAGGVTTGYYTRLPGYERSPEYNPAHPIAARRSATKGPRLHLPAGLQVRSIIHPGIKNDWCRIPHLSGSFDHQQRDVIELGHVPGELLDTR
jgi:hypothetical protein